MALLFLERKTKRDASSKKEDAPLEVRCPLCSWKHDWKPHWMCELCDAHFDTFKTRANCPNQTCGNRWHLTWCPTCGDPSPHEDWYVRKSVSS